MHGKISSYRCTRGLTPRHDPGNRGSEGIPEFKGLRGLSGAFGSPSSGNEDFVLRLGFAREPRPFPLSYWGGALGPFDEEAPYRVRGQL